MVIKRLGAQRFSGVESDVASLPIDADLLGAIFDSTDTLEFWIFNGTSWSKSAGGGGITGINPNSTILDHSTTLGDYTSPTTATASTEDGANVATNAVDGSTATFWKSLAGINESITIDMGAVGNNFALAFYIDKVQTGITETVFQIIDDTSGLILRTVLVADLIDQTYNFIRFNGINTQLIRIEGSSGSSLVMAANDLQVLQEADPPLTTTHGQFTINGTNSSLALNGGDPVSSVIEDPQVNSLTLNNVGTQADPIAGASVLWQQTLDANNEVSRSKMKINGSIQEVRWF